MKRALRNAEIAIKNAATVVQRCSRSFLSRMQSHIVRNKQAKEVAELLESLPDGAVDAASLIGTGYRRSLHVTRALSLQFARFDFSSHLLHPKASKALYSAHGLSQIHTQLEQALEDLTNSKLKVASQMSAREAASIVEGHKRDVRRLRGGVSLLRALRSIGQMRAVKRQITRRSHRRQQAAHIRGVRIVYGPISLLQRALRHY